MPFWTYLVAILLLAGLVLVHETGHYLAARRLRITVPEFSLGFGPRLGSFHAAGTEWTIRAIPLGGYCRFAEAGLESWDLAPLSARAWVMLAGPVANVLLFFLLLPVVERLAGVPWERIPATTASWGSIAVGSWVGSVGQMMQGSLAEASGPIVIAATTAQAAGAGLTDLLLLAAWLSLNLALINLLPLPIFDGGRLLMLGLEWARGRRLRTEVEGWIYAGGAMVMVALVALLLVKDVATLTAPVAPDTASTTSAIQFQGSMW